MSLECGLVCHNRASKIQAEERICWEGGAKWRSLLPCDTEFEPCFFEASSEDSSAVVRIRGLSLDGICDYDRISIFGLIPEINRAVPFLIFSLVAQKTSESKWPLMVGSLGKSVRNLLFKSQLLLFASLGSTIGFNFDHRL
jgi:hypothetical protein